MGDWVGGGGVGVGVGGGCGEVEEKAALEED